MAQNAHAEIESTHFTLPLNFDVRNVIIKLFLDGWMNGVLGHFYALSRLNWAGDNLG